MKSNKTFIIFGMGRSGTSLIAKALHKLGVKMGDSFLTVDKANPEGYFEDIEFLNLNKEILKSCGSSARNPPSQDKINENKLFDDKCKDLIKKKDVNNLWGWKDPRTVFTINKYVKHLKDPILVVPFRNLEKVGESLAKRDGITVEQGIELAKKYNNIVIKYLKENYT